MEFKVRPHLEGRGGDWFSVCVVGGDGDAGHVYVDWGIGGVFGSVECEAFQCCYGCESIWLAGRPPCWWGIRTEGAGWVVGTRDVHHDRAFRRPFLDQGCVVEVALDYLHVGMECLECFRLGLGDIAYEGNDREEGQVFSELLEGVRSYES